MNERRHGHGALGHRDDRRDYIPAAGLDALLPAYDLISRVVGSPRLHRRLVELADLRAEHRVLEIGCGTGNLTVLAKRRQPDAEVVGLDPDPRALARATGKAAGLGIRFDRGYSQALPYPDGSFDRVLSALMLHHLEGEVRIRTAREALRVLRPGGALYLVDIGGRVSPSDGFAARRQLRSERLRPNLGDAVPQLLLGAGFAECVELTNLVGRLLGRSTFYRATRAA
ncbi:MAG TPA: methyltransferase domain-containing protein [Pseudonocardia sp.]